MNIKTALCIYALCFILIDSTIFNPIRQHLVKIPILEKLFNCYFCMGCWAALAVWLCQHQPLPPLGWASSYSLLEFMLSYAGLTWGMHLFFSLLEGLAAFLAYRLDD